MSAPATTVTFCIACDHPALPGHFPGRPVVPGAVILSEIVAAARERLKAPVRTFASVKFLSPLLPEETASIEFTVKAPDRVEVDVRVRERRVASGSLRLAPP